MDIYKNIAYLPWRGNNAIIFFSSLEWEWRVISTCHGGIKQATGRRKNIKKKGGENQRKVSTTWEAQAFRAASKLIPSWRVWSLLRKRKRVKRGGRDKTGGGKSWKRSGSATRHDVDDSVEWEDQRTRQLFAHGLYKNPFSLKKKIE